MTPQHENPSTEPSLARKAANFGGAVVRHLADGRRRVSEAVYQRRLTACRGCEHCDVARMVCRHEDCGCRVRIKAFWNSEECPVGRWEDEPSGERTIESARLD